MRVAVVFASYVDDDKAEALGGEYLCALEKNFGDCDIYVGINPCSRFAQWCHRLEHSKARGITYAMTPSNLVINSDVSAYQTALKLLWESGKEYDLVWFAHTKGATSGQSCLARHYMAEFLGRKDVIAQSFDNPRVGVYGLECALHPHGLPDKISQYRKYNGGLLDVMILYSFYVMRGGIVTDFLRTCSRDFFTERIKGDRYFFERDFYQIAFMQGFIPVVEKVVQFHFGGWDEVVSNRETFERVVSRMGSNG